MSGEEEKNPSESGPRYVWDPKKLTWVETTEAEVRETTAEEAAVAPETREVVEEGFAKAGAEEVAEEVKLEARVEADAREVVAESIAVKGAKAEEGGIQYKGAGIRLVALIVDLVVFVVISVIVGQVSGSSGIINSTSGTTVARALDWQEWLYIGIITTYFVGFWTWRGQTPGKMLTGMKIVKTNGRPIGIGRAILRFFVFFLYLMLWGLTGTLGYLFAIMIGILLIIPFNKKRRTIHDFIAGTVVVGSHAPAPQAVELEASSVSELSDPPGTGESVVDGAEQAK